MFNKISVCPVGVLISGNEVRLVKHVLTNYVVYTAQSPLNEKVVRIYQGRETERSCVMGSFIICIIFQVLLRSSNQRAEEGGQ